MREKVYIKDFLICEDGENIEGRVRCPKTDTILGAKMVVPGYPDLKSLVWQAQSVVSDNFIRNGVKYDIGDWYITILIYNVDIDFSLFNIFYLEKRSESEIESERLSKKNINTDINTDLIHIKFRNMSKRRFGNFYLDIRGGETGGSGRNEHGEPHFHIISYKDNADIGKVFFPTVDDYNNNNTNLKFVCDIDRKNKKDIKKWVFDNNLENLRELNDEWLMRNKDNNRT